MISFAHIFAGHDLQNINGTVLQEASCLILRTMLAISECCRRGAAKPIQIGFILLDRSLKYLSPDINLLSALSM
jgi:hypothetical protein